MEENKLIQNMNLIKILKRFSCLVGNYLPPNLIVIFINLQVLNLIFQMFGLEINVILIHNFLKILPLKIMYVSVMGSL